VIAIAATGALCFGAWVYLAAARGQFWRTREQGRRDASRSARVTAVIPARNEAGHVGPAVRSLTDQMPVVVVDDHSEDATAEEARTAGAEVISAPALPPGWTGKMWAMNTGTRHALAHKPDYLLLTDADVTHGADAVRSLVGRAERDGLDLASYMVQLRTESRAERLLVPAFVFFFLKLYPPQWIADPKRATAGAAGGCILIGREALERLGGIEAIRGELIDDCALANRVKRSGGRIWMGLTQSSASTRAYDGPGEFWRMISCTAFTQLDHSALLLIGTVSGMTALYIAPVALALFAHGFARAFGAGAWAIMSAIYAPMLRFYRVPLWHAPLLPAVALFYTGATIDSAIRYWTGSGGRWKGRVQDARGALQAVPDDRGESAARLEADRFV
jgi:hopene-associated glycosyltransferase HpnB